MDGSLLQAAQLIRKACNPVILTGAGFSTPSGIPDFRSPGSGLWEKVNPFKVASLSAFRSRPDQFYQWLRPMAELILGSRPNSAHYAIAELETSGKLRTVITQNIDGLHQEAGSESVLEIHGTISKLICSHCLNSIEFADFIKSHPESDAIPICLDCNQILKPNAILFGEQVLWETWQQVKASTTVCDLMLVAGSSLTVMPAARLPFEVVEKGIPLIVINKSPTYMDQRADITLRGDILDIVPKLTEAVLRA